MEMEQKEISNNNNNNNNNNNKAIWSYARSME